MSAKSRVTWKERTSPARTRRIGLNAEMSSPPISTLPGIGAQMSGHQIDEGCLAGAIRADQRHPVALLQRQGDIARHVQSAEGLLQAINLEECRHLPPFL